jgi:glutathione S-transferase
MNLYFAPLACSMASRIALYEAGAAATFTRVDTKAKQTETGADFFAVNPMGQVPTLALDDGSVLTENAAVLQYLADRFPEAELAPAAGSPERYRLQQWLNFVSTELHKATFAPLLDRQSPDGAKAYAKTKAGLRFDVLNRHLSGRQYLLERYSVADMYLFTVLNWGQATQIDLSQWPAIRAFYERVRARPAVARALSEEAGLYAQERARVAARA